MAELLAAIYLVGCLERGRYARTIATLRRHGFDSLQIVEALAGASEET